MFSLLQNYENLVHTFDAFGMSAVQNVVKINENHDEIMRRCGLTLE